MSKPIQPGELCVVVGPVETPGLKNRFVIAEKFYSSSVAIWCEGLKYGGDGPCWEVRSASEGVSLPMLHFTGKVLFVQRRVVRADCLKPIRGDEEPSNTTIVAHELAAA